MKIDISVMELFADGSKLPCYEKIIVMINNLNHEVLYLTVENILPKSPNLYKSRGIFVLI